MAEQFNWTKEQLASQSNKVINQLIKNYNKKARLARRIKDPIARQLFLMRK